MKQSTKIIAAVLSTIILGVFLFFIGTMCTKSMVKSIDEALAPHELKDGLSDKWQKLLRDDYHLHIPKSAVYLKGYEIEGRELDVYIMFTVDADDFDRMFGDNWEGVKEDKSGSNGEPHPIRQNWPWNELDPHHILKHTYNYTKKSYTSLRFSDPDKYHKITCVFAK